MVSPPPSAAPPAAAEPPQEERASDSAYALSPSPSPAVGATRRAAGCGAAGGCGQARRVAQRVLRASQAGMWRRRAWGCKGRIRGSLSQVWRRPPQGGVLSCRRQTLALVSAEGLQTALPTRAAAALSPQEHRGQRARARGRRLGPWRGGQLGRRRALRRGASKQHAAQPDGRVGGRGRSWGLATGVGGCKGQRWGAVGPCVG
jgi:hypothetical protein